MLRYAIISIGLALLAIAIAPFDYAITGAINMTGETGDDRRIMALSEIFAHGFGVAIVLLLIICLAPDKIRRIPRLLSCLLLSGVCIHLIKHLVARRRPQSFGELTHVKPLQWETSISPGATQVDWNSEYLLQSFPSGHSATAFCIALGLSWLFPRGRYVFFTLAVMAMLQRIMFLAHWPSDVLFGAAIATMVAGNVFTAALSTKAFAWIEKNHYSSTPGNHPDLLKWEPVQNPYHDSKRRAA